jgi:hypothetical protein
LDALFLARLEQLLYLYALPYDERYPVVCFDERPCFLIGERVEGLAMKAGQVAREHYSYVNPSLGLGRSESFPMSNLE